jgi:hypothetical protein
MDRDRLLGPGSTEHLQSGESFVEEHDRRWGPFGAVGGGLLAILLWKPAMALITGTGPLAPPAQAAPPATLERFLEQGAAEARMQLPHTVDEATTLIAVAADGRRLVYDLRLSVDIPAAQIAEARAAMQASNRTAICAQPPGRDLIRRGAVLVHRYADPSGDRFETQVDACSA